MTIAFFYHQPAALDRNQHRDLCITPLTDARFAAHCAAAPLVAAEFAEACLEYPIVFAKNGDEWSALAVTGVAQGSNLFVDAAGQWSGHYLPASVRRYPFILSSQADGQLGVCVDVGHANVGTESGERLFDEVGEPTVLLKNAMELLGKFQAQATATSALIARLSDASLLTNSNINVSLPDGRAANLNGVWVVDEAKLSQLPDATVTAWFKSGELGLVYAHLLSLRNLTALLRRQIQ